MDAARQIAGLTQAEAATRLAQFGPNIIAQPSGRTLPHIIVHTLKEPMFLLLLGAAAIYLFVGELSQGIFMTAGALLSFGLVIIQEARSERALRALNALAEPRARVIREGKDRWIPARELVRGDLMLVFEGARVAADAVLIEGDAIAVDESALTGESAPVTKKASRTIAAPLCAPGEELGSSLFASTFIVRGQGIARVAATGASTEIGRIGSELKSIAEQPTSLQRDLRRLIGRIGIAAIGFCLVVALTYAVIRNDWFTGALNGLTLAISLIPEEFPMVLTIFMALGALRLAKQNVLVRRAAVIETLGATDLLCVDKTGTITQNQMTLRYAWVDDRSYDLKSGIPDKLKEFIRAARRASNTHGHDPMDAAINRVADHLSGNPLRTYPFSPQLLAFVQVWPSTADTIVYAAKGALESLLPLCDPARDRKPVEEAAQKLAEKGARVIAVAQATIPAAQKGEPKDIRFTLLGLLGFEDPVRSEVPQAILRAKRAGVSVAMITGDYPPTAKAIAAEAGIDVSEGVLTGSELKHLLKVPDRVRVFARINPEQKLRLIKEFQRAGHVVSMTGDGINDAPALAAADVGIAMGKRGTDVAREASDLILLDDKFTTIVAGIALGRRIFANLRRAMTFITAAHIPVAGLALLPILLGLPPLFYPMHLVLLELLFDPLCSIVFEGEPSEEGAMRRAPRAMSEPLFGWRQIALAAVQGAILLAAVLAYFAWMNTQADAQLARASAFLALVAGHLSLAIANGSSSGAGLSLKRNPAFPITVSAAVLVLVLVFTIPFFIHLFGFTIPTAGGVIASVAIGIFAGGCTGLWLRPRIQNASATVAPANEQS